jgi:surface protein
MMSASKTLKKNLSIAVTAVFLAVAAFACWAIEPSKAYADNTDSHLTVASEVHVLVDSEGNVTIPNATVTNDGTCAAYIMGCSSPDGLGWTCDAVGKRIEVGQSITATWRSAGPVSDEIAAQLGEEPYYAGNLTYTYTDGDLKGTVSLDNTDPTVGDTITATVTGANVPDDKLTYRWVKVKDGSETSIDGATGSTYTATDDDAGYELVCKVSSTDDICQGTISGATGAVKKIQAFAVYSADDDSLNFYKRAEVPKQGTMYLGKRATAVYTGLENMTSAPGWMLNYSKDIKTATVYDDGISPTDTGFWFAELRNMKTADVLKLDMSKCKTIGCMFTNCTSLTSLDLSTWNTRSLTDMNQAFQNCTSLTKLNVSGWDVSKVTNMTLAFAEDRALSSLDLSTWDNSAVTSMKDVFSMMDSLNEVSLGSKFKFVGTSPFLPDQTGHVAGADGKWYDTDGNGYAPADIPSNKAMTYYASKDLLPKAFAVYSAPADDDYDDDDGASLNFYKRSGVPAVGEQFEGKTVTAVYTGIEENTYTRTSQPWENYQSEIKTATVVDEGITPISTAYWFIYCDRLTSCDLNKLDTSNLTNMSDMFGKCRRLTSVGDLSGWNTSSVTNMSRMFYGCSKLSVDCSTWDVSKVTDHVWFNEMARGVTVPLAWQTSSDESVDDSAIATLCEEQGNGDALSVPSENDNDEETSKTNGKASADSETEGSNTASADDAGAKEEEAPGDIVQEEPAAA